VATIRHLLSVSQLLLPSAYSYTAYFVEYIQHTLLGIIYTAYFIWYNTWWSKYQSYCMVCVHYLSTQLLGVYISYMWGWTAILPTIFFSM